MASKIEWTDETWNPFVGCTKVSPGCANCYAARMASRFPAKWGDVAVGGEWTGKIDDTDSHIRTKPFRWRKPRRVFVCSMSDLFHESILWEEIARIMVIIKMCERHTFQILTKRAKNMALFFQDFGPPPKNVWLGVTAENQEMADERIPFLLEIPAAVRFVSVEPMLGPVDLMPHLGYSDRKIHWVICGGESGPGARPMNPAWPMNLLDQCVEAEIPFMFKQWGEWSPYGFASVPRDFDKGQKREKWVKFQEDGKDETRRMFRVGKNAAGRELAGRIWNEFPKVAENES